MIIIVFYIKSSLYRFALFLHNVINNSISASQYGVTNSFLLYNKLSEMRLDETYNLFLLDVVSLFINMPIELVLDNVNKRWTCIKDHTAIPKDEFFSTISLVLCSILFSFNNVIYKQTFDIPMGFYLSSIIGYYATRLRK